MEEAQRRALRRGRARLVEALQVAPLWDPLEERGLFTRTMVEELQVGPGAGTHRVSLSPGGGPRVLSAPVTGLGGGPCGPSAPVTGPREAPVSPQPDERAGGWPVSPQP